MGAWEEFLAAPHTLGPTPGARETWHRGRTAYAVWVLRIGQPDVIARVGAVAEDLPDAIRPVAPEHLHVTAFVAGFPCEVPVWDDDVAEAKLARQADALPPGPVRLRVGGATAFLTCAVLEVEDPFGDLARLRAALADVAPEIRFAPYRPHVTVGRFVACLPTAPLADRIAPHRARPPLDVEVRALDLVTLDATVPDAPLLTRRRVPLAGR